jgi:hypothetical protein
MVPLRHPHLIFVEIVVLVVFRALQGYLEGDAVPDDPIYTHTPGLRPLRSMLRPTYLLWPLHIQ